MITIGELIERFGNLVTEEYEIGLGEVGELYDILEGDEDFLTLPSDWTKSGNEEIINLKE